MITDGKIKDMIRDSLSLVFDHGLRADRALKAVFSKNKPISFEDRGTCADSVYAITRYWRLLWEAIGTPPSKSVEAFEKLLFAYSLMKNPPIPDEEEIGKRMNVAMKKRCLRESIPDWLDERGLGELGADWEPTIASLNMPPVLTVRVNSLKTTSNELAASLAASGVTSRAVSEVPSAIILEPVPNIASLGEFKNGLFEVQNASSQLASILLAPAPGMRVIDGCAGSGGKSIHCAALMKNKGKIIALDVDQKKLDTLKRRAVKAGATIVETRCITTTKVIKRLASSGDRLLLDVPCSGTGVLRRNPDIKWRLSKEALDRLIIEQRRILSYYSRMVRPEGLLVYSNCSILRSEGEEQIRTFLDTPDCSFRLVEEKRIDPRDSDFDGFYVALLKKNKME